MDTQLEEITRSLLITVKAGLPGALIDVAAEMVSEDAAFYATIGEPVPDTPLTPPVLWTIGHHPTLLDWELAKFPNVTAMCYQHRPSDQSGDQYLEVANLAYVDAFSWHEDEDTINRIAWRYAKAIQRVIAQDPTLGGRVQPLVGTPNVDVSDAVARRVSDLASEYAYVQGCRVEYSFISVGQVDAWATG